MRTQTTLAVINLLFKIVNFKILENSQEYVSGEVMLLPRSITANLWSLTAYIYHIMIIVTAGFSKKSFLLLFLFPRNSIEQS